MERKDRSVILESKELTMYIKFAEAEAGVEIHLGRSNDGTLSRSTGSSVDLGYLRTVANHVGH